MHMNTARVHRFGIKDEGVEFKLFGTPRFVSTTDVVVPYKLSNGRFAAITLCELGLLRTIDPHNISRITGPESLVPTEFKIIGFDLIRNENGLLRFPIPIYDSWKLSNVIGIDVDRIDSIQRQIAMRREYLKMYDFNHSDYIAVRKAIMTYNEYNQVLPDHYLTNNGYITDSTFKLALINPIVEVRKSAKLMDIFSTSKSNDYEDTTP